MTDQDLAALEEALDDLYCGNARERREARQRIRDLFKQLEEERDMARRGAAMESQAGDELETEIKQRIPIAEVRELLERLRDFVVSVNSLTLPRDMEEGEMPFGTIDYMGMEQLREDIDAILKREALE